MNYKYRWCKFKRQVRENDIIYALVAMALVLIVSLMFWNALLCS